MESLIASVKSLQVQSKPVDISGDKLLSMLTDINAVKRTYLQDAIDYYTKLISDHDNINDAIAYLMKVSRECGHTISLEKSSDILQCIIIKQQVLSKFAHSTQLLKAAFPDINWKLDTFYTKGKLILNPKYKDAVFCAGIMFDERVNIHIGYKDSLKRQGYPNISSFLIKLLYNINLCMRLYSEVNVGNMINTVDITNDLSVSNISIEWKYKLSPTEPEYYDSSEE